MLHYVYNACCLVLSGQSPVGSSELVCHWEHSWEKLLHRKWKCGLQSQLSVGSSLWATPLGVWSIVNVKYWLVQLQASKHRTEVSFQAQSWRSKLANCENKPKLSSASFWEIYSQPYVKTHPLPLSLIYWPWCSYHNPAEWSVTVHQGVEL